ncbi:uncharacterized protein DS421_15g507680 [Arachis hypogaea]|nr:uncharacterized protein DS421_15g507680 [Arachis hypogaea]
MTPKFEETHNDRGVNPFYCRSEYFTKYTPSVLYFQNNLSLLSNIFKSVCYSSHSLLLEVPKPKKPSRKPLYTAPSLQPFRFQIMQG